MIIWPDFKEGTDGTGSIRHFLRKLQREKPPKYWALVNALFEKVKKSDNLEDLQRQGVVKILEHISEPIWEFRIPPGKLRGGVIRIYFAYDEYQPEITIALLAAEKKHTTSNDREMIKNAIARYREHCLSQKADIQTMQLADKAKIPEAKARASKGRRSR